MHVLVDLNLVLDVLEKRQPHLVNSAAVWKAVETGQVQGFLAAHTITTLFYLTTRQVGWQMATFSLVQVLKVFAIAAVDENVIGQALSLGWKDFEDAEQMTAALNANLDYVITRNPKDFETQPIPVLEPAVFLALLSAEK
jgi:predicted nucleic acid-binding protein